MLSYLANVYLVNYIQNANKPKSLSSKSKLLELFEFTNPQ